MKKRCSDKRDAECYHGALLHRNVVVTSQSGMALIKFFHISSFFTASDALFFFPPCIVQNPPPLAVVVHPSNLQTHFFFIFDGKYAIAGAHHPEHLIPAIDAAAAA